MSSRSLRRLGAVTLALASVAAGAPLLAGSASAQETACQPAEVVLGQSTITATGSTQLFATAAPDSVVEVYAYSRPSTEYRLVRTGTTDAEGAVRLADVRPPTNTRLYAQQQGCEAGPSTVLNVRTVLSLDVVRNGRQDYTFSGRALPARAGGLVVSLYRVTAKGEQVLTAQTRADSTTGAYSIRRTFSGTGRFGFVVRTGQDLQNAPGASNVRSLLVY